ncbi:hypothetical protein SBOR_4970 [Sclerotinia borealis F-4128]|uniref:Uncharacterized protein n=1 Tax=Sclerotinia borealis (strain F-4128) TaxID=1432307 RepID=W9CFL5_SCLBF|nr:hypothetical protein SBOR_4970 [Sclerotinia borealis F-4128]
MDQSRKKIEFHSGNPRFSNTNRSRNIASSTSTGNVPASHLVPATTYSTPLQCTEPSEPPQYQTSMSFQPPRTHPAQATTSSARAPPPINITQRVDPITRPPSISSTDLRYESYDEDTTDCSDCMSSANCSEVYLSPSPQPMPRHLKERTLEWISRVEPAHSPGPSGNITKEQEQEQEQEKGGWRSVNMNVESRPVVGSSGALIFRKKKKRARNDQGLPVRDGDRVSGEGHQMRTLVLRETPQREIEENSEAKRRRGSSGVGRE